MLIKARCATPAPLPRPAFTRVLPGELTAKEVLGNCELLLMNPVKCLHGAGDLNLRVAVITLQGPGPGQGRVNVL